MTLTKRTLKLQKAEKNLRAAIEALNTVGETVNTQDERDMTRELIYQRQKLNELISILITQL